MHAAGQTHDDKSRSVPAADRDFARQLWAAAEIALTGVQQGKSHSQIIEQLHLAGVSPQEAGNLVRYAQDVERLNTAGVVAGEGVRLGRSPAEIIDRLQQLGVDGVVARGIEARVRQNHRRSRIESARRLVLAGVTWLCGAALLAFWSTLAARPAKLVFALLLVGGTIQILYGWHRRRK